MIRFENDTAIRIKSSDITAFESLKGLTLPEDFKAHLIKYNGGSTEEDAYFKGPTGEQELQYFLPLIKDEDFQTSLAETFDNDQDFLPANHLTIGAIVGGNICMNLENDNFGALYIYFSEVELVKVASSFTEFLNMLYEV